MITKYYKNTLNCSVAAYVLPLDTINIDEYPGYAHLIEHMIFRANTGCLRQLENLNIVANAGTSTEHIMFMFIDYGNTNLLREFEAKPLSSFLNVDFTQKDLEIERHVITQERLYKQNDPNFDVIDETLGSFEEISAFDIDTLATLSTQLRQNAIRLLSTSSAGSNTIDLSSIAIEASASAACIFGFEKVIELDDSEKGLLRISVSGKKNLEGLLHMVRILYSRSTDYCQMRINRAGVVTSIEVKDTKLGFLRRLSKSNQYRDQYVFQLNSLRFYLDEMAYVSCHF